MSGKNRARIVEGLKKLNAKPNEVVSGYVSSVDEASNTMTVMLYDGELEVEGVLLRGTDEEGLDGIIQIPALDSDVVICSVDGVGEWMLLRATKLTKVLLSLGQTKLEVSDGSIMINGGDNAGLVNVKALQQKLNALESDLNAIKQVFTAWTPVPNDGGAALKAAAGTWAAQQITETAQADIEDTKVTH